MSIPLSTVLSINRPGDHKAHLACWNGKMQPLDVFVRDRNEWNRWNTWRSAKNEFNRPFIFSLIDFYHEPDTWLFGGIYEVVSRNAANFASSYDVRLLKEHTALIGRLKIAFKRPSRSRSVRLENYLSHMRVSEILKEVFNGEQFPGYENICHDFGTLEAIVRAGRPDWKAALENVKGVYLIVDKNNGRKYVGSAYGDSGIWARWCCYIGTCHGWNDELTKLIEREGREYARQYFRISLLEYRSAKTDDGIIIARESFWKEALQSRKHGYNKN